MPEEVSSIGLGVRETKKRFDELIIDFQKVTEERSHLIPNQSGERPKKYDELSLKLATISEEINQLREWYHIGLSESLNNETKRLNALTKVLIVLTAILGSLAIIDILTRLMIHA